MLQVDYFLAFLRSLFLSEIANLSGLANRLSNLITLSKISIIYRQLSLNLTNSQEKLSSGYPFQDYGQEPSPILIRTK